MDYSIIYPTIKQESIELLKSGTLLNCFSNANALLISNNRVRLNLHVFINEDAELLSCGVSFYNNQNNNLIVLNETELNCLTDFINTLQFDYSHKPEGNFICKCFFGFRISFQNANTTPETPSDIDEVPRIDSILTNNVWRDDANVSISDYVNTLRFGVINNNISAAASIGCDADGNYFMQSQSNGLYIKTGANACQIETTHNPNTVLFVHTHTNSNSISPTAMDVIKLCKAYQEGAVNIYGNVSMTYDQSEYVVYVNDSTAFAGFCNNEDNLDFFVISNDNHFVEGSIWADAYANKYNSWINQNYSAADANAYALLYVLETYNTGLKIVGRSTHTLPFKELKIPAQ
jgi:hypothetical protein